MYSYLANLPLVDTLAPMNPPEAVVFDLGKVLLDFDYEIAVRKMVARCDLPANILHDLINQSPLLFQYETGLLTTGEFYESVKAAAGFRGDVVEFRAIFGDIFTPIEPMIALHERLRSQGIPTYIFSNTNELAIDHIRRQFPFFSRFEDYVLSYEHRAMKPDAKLYEVVEQRTGRRGAQLLYIDDRPENIAAGKARHWRTILHASPEQTLAELRETGLM